MPVDVTFALDASGSVGKPNFARQIDFVRSLVMGLNINTDSRVAAIRYANNANMHFNLNDYCKEAKIKFNIMGAVAYLSPKGWGDQTFAKKF